MLMVNPFAVVFVVAMVSMLGALVMYLRARGSARPEANKVSMLRSWGVTSAAAAAVALVLYLLIPM